MVSRAVRKKGLPASKDFNDNDVFWNSNCENDNHDDANHDDQVELMISQARLKRKTHASPNGIASGLKRKRDDEEETGDERVKRQYEYIQVRIFFTTNLDSQVQVSR